MNESSNFNYILLSIAFMEIMKLLNEKKSTIIEIQVHIEVHIIFYYR